MRSRSTDHTADSGCPRTCIRSNPHRRSYTRVCSVDQTPCVAKNVEYERGAQKGERAKVDREKVAFTFRMLSSLLNPPPLLMLTSLARVGYQTRRYLRNTARAVVWFLPAKLLPTYTTRWRGPGRLWRFSGIPQMCTKRNRHIGFLPVTQSRAWRGHTALWPTLTITRDPSLLGIPHLWETPVTSLVHIELQRCSRNNS